MIKELNEENKNEDIYVVSGLPRSGTSMMMNLLNLGGIPAITDGIRKADNDNPLGYWEYEKVKDLQFGSTQWLNNAKGKSIKVISYLLEFLPNTFVYKIIFLERKLNEIIESQNQMLSKNNSNMVDNNKLINIYSKHIIAVKNLMSHKTCFSVLYLNYNEILRSPEIEMKKLMDFLEKELDIDKMLRGIDKSLYRKRMD